MRIVGKFGIAIPFSEDYRKIKGTTAGIVPLIVKLTLIGGNGTILLIAHCDQLPNLLTLTLVKQINNFTSDHNAITC